MKYSKEHLPVKVGGRRSGLKLSRVGFVVAHDTGNKNSTARNNRDYYMRTAAGNQQSAHVFVDDVEAIELVPLNEKAWHVRYDSPIDNQLYGDDANDISLGIELCYFDDKARTLKAYENYVKIIAGWLKTYKLNIRDLTGHFVLDPARRTDPINAFKTIGKTWEEFLKDVTAELSPKPSLIKPKNLKKLGVATMLKDVPAYARPQFGTQTGDVVKKGVERNIYAIQNGWYQMFSGEWIPSNYFNNFKFEAVDDDKKPTAKPLHSVEADGKNLGAFEVSGNIANLVKDAVDKGANTITVKRVK